MSEPTVAAIVAMDDARVIGRDGALPWHIPEDLAHFKRLTMGGVVVMGRKTWDSLPAKVRPLPGRINIVVSRAAGALNLPEGVFSAASPDEGLRLAKELATPNHGVWIIGGAELYRTTLDQVDEVHLTQVAGVHDGDTFLPQFEDRFSIVSEQHSEGCVFRVYRRS